MIQIIVLTSVIVALSLLLIGVKIFIFGQKFPETEVGKNKNMIRLGLRCPHCEERARYKQHVATSVNMKTLRPDWKSIR